MGIAREPHESRRLGLAVKGRSVDPLFWAGRRVLLTGHTGFKGSWMSLWLAQMKARVVGFALPPDTAPSLFELADVPRDVTSVFGDIRDRAQVAEAVAQADPEIAMHFAAQPLVQRSFAEPVETFATNVMGTVHLLEALRHCRHLKVVLVVTTDKVYENADTGAAFREGDRLGGHDPYAASKAATELVVSSYAAAFMDPAGIPIATGRGGNVIGGGDFSKDRIVPDIWRALSLGKAVTVRHPHATRPWQHVLDCLSGYLLYVESLAQDRQVPRALNFGPGLLEPISVAVLVETLQRALGVSHGWLQDTVQHPPEKRLLALDTSLARQVLGWRERLPDRAAIDATASWYKTLSSGADMRTVTLKAIGDYVS